MRPHSKRAFSMCCASSTSTTTFISWGCAGVSIPNSRPEVAAKLVEARHQLASRLAANDQSHLVERFDPERYNANSSIGANLLFGTPIGHEFDGDGLARSDYMLGVLAALDLPRDLISLGEKLARTSIELFAGMEPGHQIFEEFSFLGADELSVFERILGRADKLGIEGLLPEERVRLLGLGMKLIAARDPLGLLDDALQTRIVAARHKFAEDLPEGMRGAVEFFDPERYNAAASIQENLLFGTIRRGEAGGRERINAAMSEVLSQLELRDMVIAVGLEYPVGTGGLRLSETQRQKVAIGVALLKRPDVVLFNDATVVLDGSTETAIIDQVKRELTGRSLVCSLQRPRLASAFDRILVMDGGRIIQQGRFDELQQAGSPLEPLMAAE